MAEEKINQLTSAVENMTTLFQNLNAKIENMEKNPSSSMFKNMEKMFHNLNDGGAYHEVGPLDSSLSAKLPEKFSANDLPKFKPTDDPRFHLKGFRATMALKGIDPELYPTVFPLSLEPVCQKWFFLLPEKDTSTWEDVAHAFMTRYKGNVQVHTSFRELEILKQEEKDGFTTYLSRWRQAAAEMINTPPEAEMVKTFIANLQPKYKTHLRYMGLETFDKVYHIGIAIEDDLLKEGNKDFKWGNNNNNNNYKKNDGSGSSKTVSALQTSEIPFRRPRREYTPIGMTYTQAFDRLKSKGALLPVGPTADPDPEYRSKNWDPTKYCKYHQGKGHNTEECFKLKDVIQDMIEDGRLPIPPGAKKPNTQSNPLASM